MCASSSPFQKLLSPLNAKAISAHVYVKRQADVCHFYLNAMLNLFVGSFKTYIWKLDMIFENVKIIFHVSHSFLVTFSWHQSSQWILENRYQMSNRFNCLDKLSSFLLSDQPSFNTLKVSQFTCLLSNSIFRLIDFCHNCSNVRLFFLPLKYFSSLPKSVRFVKS